MGNRKNIVLQKRYRDRYRYVVLRFCGKELVPDKMTESLELIPAFASEKGDWKGKSGKIYHRPVGQWSIDSRLNRNATLQNHVKDILEQIRPKKKILRRILRNAKADLNIAVQPHEDLAISAYTFPAEIISEFVSLGIDIRFSIHVPHN